MNSLTRRIIGVSLGLAMPIVLIGLGFAWWVHYGDFDRPTTSATSPPPWLEGREKYNWEGVRSTSHFDNIPVDIWFGKRRDDEDDTTHFRIANDYLGNMPQYHGSYVTLNVVWPSLRSLDEEEKIRTKEGLLPILNRDWFRITLKETRGDGSFFTDKLGTGPVTKCEPMIRDEKRGVRFCNENRFNGKPGKRWTNYWPLNESIRTPVYGNQPRFGCYVVHRPDGTGFNRCDSYFSYDKNVHVQINASEATAIAILNHFSKLIDFIHKLKVKS